MERIKYIDRLKGFAIILVIIGHLYIFSYEWNDSVVLNLILSFHMFLFMFLSGLVTSTRYYYWDLNTIFGRIKRLLIPMLLFGTIFTLSFYDTSSFKDILPAMWKMLCAPAKSGYWYLMSLSVFYVILQLFRFNIKQTMAMDVALSACIFVSLYIGYKYLAQEVDIFCLLNSASLFPAFMLGHFCNKYDLLKTRILNKYTIMSCFVLYIVLFYVNDLSNWSNAILSRWIIPFLATMVIVYVFLKREKESSVSERLLEHIGRYTLEIYLFHYFLVTKLKLSYFNAWLYHCSNELLLLPLIITMAIAIALVSIFIGKVLRRIEFIDVYIFGTTK